METWIEGYDMSSEICYDEGGRKAWETTTVPRMHFLKPGHEQTSAL